MYTEADIKNLEAFYIKCELPDEIQLNAAEKITDLRQFVDSHLTIARSYIGSDTFASFYARLVKVRDIINGK